MSVVKKNYVPGESETLSQENAGIVDSSSYQYFAFGGYFKYEVGDPIIYATASKTLVDSADYDLVVDEKYTTIEASYSGKTLIAQIKFTNPAYDGEPFWVTGLNFGSMVDNEEIVRYVDDGRTPEFDQVNSDWGETDPAEPSYIDNQPVLFTVSTDLELTTALNTIFPCKVIEINSASINFDYLVASAQAIYGVNHLYGCGVTIKTINEDAAPITQNLQGSVTDPDARIYLHCNYVVTINGSYPPGIGEEIRIKDVNVYCRNITDSASTKPVVVTTDASFEYEKGGSEALGGAITKRVWDNTGLLEVIDGENTTVLDFGDGRVAVNATKQLTYVTSVYDQAGLDAALEDTVSFTIIIEKPLSWNNPTPLVIDTAAFGNKDLNIVGVGTEVVLKEIVAPDGFLKSVNIMCDVVFTEDVTIGQNIGLKCRRLNNDGNHSITYNSGSSFTYEEVLVGNPPNDSVFEMWHSTGGLYVDEYSNENVTPRNNSFSFLSVDVQADFTYNIPDASPDRQFYAYLGRLGGVNAGRVRIQTESGTQLVGGQLTQIITGDREGITVVSRGSGYEIVQDSRGASVLKLPGVLENKDYILKVDDNTISIVTGIGRFRKSNKNVVQFSWDSVVSQPVTIADNTLQWVMFKLSVGETGIELLFVTSGPSSLLEYEGYTLIGRIWKEAGVLRVGDRHIGLSIDPYISRTEAWGNKSDNLSVVGSFSPTDNNLLSFSTGELYRWPVVEKATNHHIWLYSGDPAIFSMWEHMQNQTSFNIISDNGAGDETDIRLIADYYDNNGVHTALANNDFTVHLIGVYAGSGVEVFVRGQETFTNMASAEIGIITYSPKLSEWASDFDQISFVSWVIMREGTTDFSDPALVKFVSYSKVGGGGSGEVAVSYDHATAFGRKGSNTFPANTDIDLPVTWFEEDPAGTWGFDGQGASNNATLPALLAGSIVGFSINFETLSTDIEVGFKLNGVEHATTWTIVAANKQLLQIPINIEYAAGQEVIPFVRHTATWGGTGIRCLAYSRGVVS